MSAPNSQRISYVVQNDGTTEIHENGRHIATAYGPDTARRIGDALAKSNGPADDAAQAAMFRRLRQFGGVSTIDRGAGQREVRLGLWWIDDGSIPVAHENWEEAFKAVCKRLDDRSAETERMFREQETKRSATPEREG